MLKHASQVVSRSFRSGREWWREKRYLQRVRNFFRVLKRGWPFWLTLLGLIGAWVASYFLADKLEDQIRYTGFLLELLGVLNVAVGLSETRKLFGRPSVFSEAASWLKQLRGALKQPITGTINLSGAASSTSAASGRIIQGLREDAPVEERLKYLEDRYKELRSDFSDTSRRLNQSISAVRDQLSKERRERQEQTDKLRIQLEELTVGGLKLETIGLVWLLIGIVCSSIPAELASLF
ncbi:hypothetical protein [Rubrivirga sp.]|uniref:hypothetical protein n=1 Tax=Rubrivirga sp. TaxID=1885344 RepID=UPI003B52DE3C